MYSVEERDIRTERLRVTQATHNQNQPTMSSNDKAARIAAMKAKKATADAARGLSTTNVVTARPTGSKTLSRAQVSGVILSAPRPGERCSYVDIKLAKIEDPKTDGLMRIPSIAANPTFALAPFTDEKGDYRYMYDDKYQKTSERKPIELGEMAITTVKLLDPPKGGADWNVPLCLTPGQTLTLSSAALTPVFKMGTCLVGTYKPSETAEPVAKKPLDFQLPALAFQTVSTDDTITNRNLALSVGTGGFATAWQSVPATDVTKQYAVTLMGNERTSILEPNGAWMKEMANVAAEGDEPWKKETEKLCSELNSDAVFKTEGLGPDFRVASHGPTMMLPVFAIGVDFGLSDGLPGIESNAGKMMQDEQVDQPFFFEGAMCMPSGDKQVFGSAFKQGRASGGPWLKLALNTFTAAPDVTEVVSLYAGFTTFVPLPSMAVHFGSKHLQTIERIAVCFLPLVDMVVSFEADRNNIATNTKSAEAWDCRVPTVDFYGGLTKYGVEVAIDAALDHFKEKPIVLEDAEIAKVYTSSPKPLLACGFTLLNENGDARSKDWLQMQGSQMEKIASANGRADAKSTIKAYAINPESFEAHKTSLADLEKVDLIDRFEYVGDDWLIYAVLVLDDGTDATNDSEPQLDPGSEPEPEPDGDPEPQPMNKAMKKKASSSAAPAAKKPKK